MILAEEPPRGLQPSRRWGADRGEQSPNDPRNGETKPTLRRVRLLIVDDDPSFLAAASRALVSGSAGFDVVTADTGFEAVDLLKRAGAGEAPLPDVILLDYHLPDTTAPTLLRRLAAYPWLKELPVLVLTRDERESARDDALDAGATEFASKPSRVQALRDIVVQFWETHGAAVDDSTH
jgi:CheY-like chemotaxis protein